MNYTNWILQRLLDKYYESAGFIKGEGRRRVLLKPAEEKFFQERLEDADAKELILDTLATLKNKNMLDYSWVKYEEGNLLEAIWLNTEEKNIQQICSLLKVKPRRQQLDQLSQLIYSAMDKLEDSQEICCFLQEQLEYLQRKCKLSRYFSEDMDENANLLQFLIAMVNNDSEQFERVLSSSLYQDSKYFERVLKSKVLSILRAINKKETAEDISDDALLGAYGITRWPEILEFCGDVELVFKSGAKIDFSSLEWGASINSMAVPEITEVKIGHVSRVLFVENRANYFLAVQHRQCGELIIYHGGFYSPVRGKWFKMLYAACNKAANIDFYHWSDIDLGGFRIFTRLKKNIIPQLQPWKMDVETLSDNKNNAIPINNKVYLKALENLLDDEEYAMFHPVINSMLKDKIRLEQESELFKLI